MPWDLAESQRIAGKCWPKVGGFQPDPTNPNPNPNPITRLGRRQRLRVRYGRSGVRVSLRWVGPFKDGKSRWIEIVLERRVQLKRPVACYRSRGQIMWCSLPHRRSSIWGDARLSLCAPCAGVCSLPKPIQMVGWDSQRAL